MSEPGGEDLQRSIFKTIFLSRKICGFEKKFLMRSRKVGKSSYNGTELIESGNAPMI